MVRRPKTKKPVCQKLKTAFLSELGFIGLRDFKMVSCLEIVLHTEAGSLKPGDWELEAGRSKTEVGSWELGAGRWRPKTEMK